MGVVQLLLARQDVDVNKADETGVTALMMASQNGHIEVARLLLAHPDVEANKTTQNGATALIAASLKGHGAIVRLLVAHRAHGQVRLLAADVIDSLPAVLFEKIPGYAVQVAALCLPLDVAAALGDTEEERAAADVLVSQSALLEVANAHLAAAAMQTPQELARACEVLACAHVQSPSDAASYTAREREADAALRAAVSMTAFRLAQAHQLTIRMIFFHRFHELVLGAQVSDAFQQIFIVQRLQEIKLAQAESAASFALRHNGQEPADRLLGATRALATAITALVA